MQEIFEENETEMLQGAIIWAPMLETDSREAAETREAGFSDDRVQHFWDPGRILGRLLSRTLKLKAPLAWDVYLIYPPGHIWDDGLPPAPRSWMHQLDEEPSLLLNPVELKQSLQAMIEELGRR